MNIFSSLTSPFKIEGFDEDGNKKFKNGIFANGIWQKRKEPVGTFTIQVEKFDGKPYGFTEVCEPTFESALPKIPMTLLSEVVKFFRTVMAQFKSEVYISIYWNKTTEDYFVYVPTQKVSGASVVFENDPEMMNNPEYVIVMDIHSHVNMGAFFSGQDLKDEAASRLFGVIGKLGNEQPEGIFRAASNRQEIPLDIEDIFTLEYSKLQEDSNYEINEDQISKISERTFAAPVVYSGGRTGAGGLSTYKASDYYKHNNWGDDYDVYDDPMSPYSYEKSHYYSQTRFTPTVNIYTALNKFKSLYTLTALGLTDFVTTVLDFIVEECSDKDFSSHLDEKALDALCDELSADLQIAFLELLKLKEERDISKDVNKS